MNTLASQTFTKLSPSFQRLNCLNSHFLMSQTRSYLLAPIRKFSSAAKPEFNSFQAGVCVNPHYNKKAKGGEDAYVLSPQFLAVADGVGGWAESGVDPAVYSRTLCHNISELVTAEDNELYVMKPTEALIRAVEKTKVMGSSTCVLASIDPDGPYLMTSNLGDSGYLLLRKNGMDLETVFKSPS
jgi:protein phosphatase PTC7